MPDLSSLKLLTTLNLDHNFLYELPHYLFTDLNCLKVLSVVNNKLSEIPSTLCNSAI